MTVPCSSLCSLRVVRCSNLGQIRAHRGAKRTNRFPNRRRARLAVLDLDVDQLRVDDLALALMALRHGDQAPGLGLRLDYRTSGNLRIPAFSRRQKYNRPVAEPVRDDHLRHY